MNERQRPWLLRVTALVTLAGSIGVVVLLVGHRSSRPVVGPYSPSAAAALVLAVAASVVSLVIAVLPTPSLSRFQRWLVSGSQPLRAPLTRGSMGHGIALGLLALVSYAVLGVRSITLNTEARDDQRDFLNVAAAIQRTGGIDELWGRLWDGTYEAGDPAAANRHPLYPALLSFRPEFTFSKWLSLGLGLFPLTAIGWATARRAGWLAGGVAAVLLATNSVFQQSASIAACEILLIGWAVLAWITIEPTLDPDASSPTQPAKLVHTGRAIRCALVGVWLGLSYLTKASSVFLLVGFAAWCLTVAALRRWGWLAIVAFAVIAAPLLVRNTRAFGDPLYSYNTRFLFADTFEDGLSRKFRGTWVEAKNYFSTHSGSAIARRALGGLGWECFILLRALGPASLGTARPLAGLAIGLMVCLGAVGADRRLCRLAGTWCAIFVVFFAWYVPIAAGDRFLAPIVPVLLTFAARGAVRVVQGDAKDNHQRVGPRIIAAAFLWCAVTMLLAFTRGSASLN